ncbi:MAG: response regulator [Anaerolineae bacterium]|nr:response regulator [Anaerolineae bacterium]
MIQAMVIDDNPKNLQILAKMLASEGAETIEVPRPIMLEPMLEEIEGLDVIFLDLEMPGLNGYEVLEIIKANPRFSEVPVVAYTVHVSEITVAHKLGFHSFLGKPLNMEKFPDQLARILAGEHVWETV